MAGVWSLLARLFQRSPGISIPLSLCLPIQCSGMTVMLAGYIKGGAATFPFVATLAATIIATSLTTKRTVTPTNAGLPATLGIGVVGLFGLVFLGRFFGRLSTEFAVTMLLSPLVCWVTELPQLRRQKPWLLSALRLVLVAIPLLAVLAVAKRNFDRDMAPLLGGVLYEEIEELTEPRGLRRPRRTPLNSESSG